MLWDDDLTGFVSWLLSSPESEASEWKTALDSVPADRWGAVWSRLSTELSRLEDQALPPVGRVEDAGTPPTWILSEEDIERAYQGLELVRRKQALLNEEWHARLQRRSPPGR